MNVIPVRAGAAERPRPLWRRVIRNRWVRRIAAVLAGAAVGWVCREIPPGVCHDICTGVAGLLAGGG